MHNDLAKHLRAWGLTVEEKDGWQDRGRPFTFKPRSVFCHHTASNRTSGNFASEGIVTFGRSDLPGPLSQFLLGRDGTVKIIAGGYCNHAGFGGPEASVPANMGNTYGWGIEAENNGVGEPWPAAQLNAYYRLCAALMDYSDIKDVSNVFGHKEWTSRKIDPAGIIMDGFRLRVLEAKKAGPSVKTVRLSRLKPGKRNKDIWYVKNRLRRRGFLDADKETMGNNFTEKTRDAYRAYQRSLGFEGNDANGIPGETSLRKLGFNVIS